MKIIISPAKKMNNREDEMDITGLPCFLSKAEELKRYIQSLDFESAKKLWGCNEKIARLNFERFASMDLERRLTPSLLSYEGIQYQYMAPGVFEKAQWDYVQEHLRILSGFYGILKPLDGVVPYRLEMQAKAEIWPKGNLYGFWGCDLYKELIMDEKRGDGKAGDKIEIVNLASKEYSKAIEPYLEENVRFLTCVFGTRTGEKPDFMKAGVKKKSGIKVKATEAKMARGEMVRYMAEHGIENMEDLKKFDRLGFLYSPEDSTENEYVFVKIENKM